MKYARITIHTKIIYRSNIILLSVADFVSVTGSQTNQETRLVIFPQIQIRVRISITVLNLTFDGGGLIRSILFLRVKTIEKVNFLEKKNHSMTIPLDTP